MKTEKQLICDCTKFYDSTVRKNKWGNYCSLCDKEIYGECKRAIWGVNQFGNTNYTTVHNECFLKSLETEIPKSLEKNKEEQKEYRKKIKELKRLMKWRK